jgi:dynein heavy chain, axonemal
MAESLNELYLKYVPLLIDRIFEGTAGEDIVEPMRFITPRTNLNLVQQLTTLIDSMLPEPNENAPQEVDQLERLYVFCVVWSLGGSLMADERDKFSDFIKASSGMMLGNSSLFDNYYDMESKSYIIWDRKVPEYVAPANRKFN